ncbi:hypothetical protein JTE90_019002 [Oedothorax gibbosus]|uniref:DUF5641 domain-containing protein n=1 Tax=Oedothorax gibbosus TaxID=931172 RepID=A0AAV6U5P7_9ARAC|nr:hypothetical protein JTE90_019002 [Oedothorax gibbosus]
MVKKGLLKGKDPLPEEIEGFLLETNQQLGFVSTTVQKSELTESGVPDLDNIDKVSLKRRLRYQQNLRDVLRKLFRDEYLGQLIMRPTKNKANQRVVVGDIVLIERSKRRLYGR